MKNILLILVLLVSVLGVTAQNANVAPTASPTVSTGQPTAEEIRQAKETLKTILDEKTPTKQQEQGKTMADVLDKGLESLTTFAGTLEGIVSKYAPEVWRIMVKQQYAKAISYPVYWGFLLLLAFVLHKVVRRGFGVPKDMPLMNIEGYSDEKEICAFIFAGVLPTVAGIIFGIGFIYYLSEAVMILINPEYYALKDIIGMLR